MHNKILAIAISLCLFESAPALAAVTSNPSEADLANALQKLTAQTEALQQEVTTLKTELSQEEQRSKTEPVPARHIRTKQQSMLVRQTVQQPPVSRYTYAPETTQTAPSTAFPSSLETGFGAGTFIAGPNITHTPSGLVSGYQPGDIIPSTVAVNKIGQPILTKEQQDSQERTADIKYLMGSTILSSPILNINSVYDASDLVVNQSTMNEDLRFLQQRQTLEALVGAENLPSQRRPEIFLSGKVEPQFIYFDPFGGPASTSIDIGSIELDTLAEASPWAYGFISFNFESNPLRNPSTLGSGNAINNSRVFLKRGFVTIGNLDKSPFYFTMGQQYVPFGNYSSYLLSNPDTLSEGRVNARAALLGFYHDGLYLSTYALNGAANTETGFDTNHVYEWGANAGYKFKSSNGFYSADIGTSYINNIAEAQGYQLNGLGSGFFQGFSENSSTEFLQHPVPGFDAHFNANIGNLSLENEFVTATKEFAKQDLSFNGSGAEPSALHIEGDYTIKNIFDTEKNLAIFLAYDRSWQSLALNIPQNSYIGGLSTSIWKNTIEAIEFRHDTNYPSSDTASGICNPDNLDEPTVCPVPVLGAKQNQVIAQIGVYF
ncbi:MAG TPA: LbtU family siderophore porin [Gammaproteobacteria bacterium]|nr:LbtU family siderophore porin [Gammaproteobacteria bacterium]